MSAPAIKQRPPTDPLRETLAAAIEAAAEAKSALHNHRNAIDKTRASVRAAEKSVEVARRGKTEAQEQFGMALADAALADDDALPPTNLARLAAAALEDAESELLALQSAYEKLRRDTSSWERNAASADAEVERAISACLVPHAERQISELRALISSSTPLRRLLNDLLESHRNVGFVGLRPIEPALDAARVTVMRHSDDDIDNVAGVWAAARQSLRANPDADIDGLLALPASAPRPPAV